MPLKLNCASVQEITRIHSKQENQARVCPNLNAMQTRTLPPALFNSKSKELKRHVPRDASV